MGRGLSKASNSTTIAPVKSLRSWLTFTVLLSVSAAVADAALDASSAEKFARLALAGLDREYPNKPGEVMRGPQDLLSPRAMHPAFFGCFDWHSSVHGHWMLVRLLRLHPKLPVAAEIRVRLAAHLTATNLAAEAAYFEIKENKSFERMYGWAWALRLAAELRSWNDPDAEQWAQNFEPLERKLVALTKDYLPRLTYPIRTGVHPDTAFALAQILDYARTVKDAELERDPHRRASGHGLRARANPGLRADGQGRRVGTPDH